MCNCSTYGRSSAQCEPQNGKCLCRRLLCMCSFQAVLRVIALRTAEAASSVNHRTGSVCVGVYCVCVHFRLCCV